MGLGIVYVIGRIRVPFPAAKIMAFINRSLYPTPTNSKRSTVNLEKLQNLIVSILNGQISSKRQAVPDLDVTFSDYSGSKWDVSHPNGLALYIFIYLKYSHRHFA